MNRRVLSVLALSFALPVVAPVATADAANIIIGSKTKKEANGKHYRISTLVAEDSSGAIETVTADVASDVGRETVPLTETDAWLHGAAPLAALPTTDAELSLTLYDRASASLISYSGRLGADGSVTLAEDATACDPYSRLGCTVTEAPDVELLAAEVYAAAGGYELVIDLVGDAAHDVAYAAVVVTEWRNLDACLEQRDTSTCGDTSHFRTTAEVGWDTIGTVWEAELSLDHEGPLTTKVKVRAEEGPTEVVMSSLGLPWLDGGAGIATLAADEDPLTTVGLIRGEEGARIHGLRHARLAVVSDGWTGATAPTHAAVELSTGETLTLPANSYQRRKRPDLLTAEWDALLDPNFHSFRLEVDGSTMTIDGGNLTFADLSSPLCAEGTCVVLHEDDTGALGLSVTQYRWDTAFPSDAVHLSLTLLDEGGAELLAAEGVVTFDDEVSVVFANDVGFDGDPLRSALAGRVSLLGAADTRGGQDTLASGRFYSTVDRHEDGGLGLAGVGVDEIASMPATRFAVLLGGEPTTCGGDDDGFTAPPPLAAVFGNGSGTKNATMTTSTKPQLL